MLKRRFLSVVALMGLAACSSPMGGGLTPISAPPVPRGDRDARYEACRVQATRVVEYRDRGQLMRSDETESGRGTVTVAPYSRVEADRGAAQIDRDRLINDCLRATEPPRAPAPGGR